MASKFTAPVLVPLMEGFRWKKPLKFLQLIKFDKYK